MNSELRDLKTREVSHAEARDELERLLQDPRFRVTERQKEILSYLAKARFEGCQAGVKAYAIALDVLGRTSDFDASLDPIVRIEISRLRSALDCYYEAFGRAGEARVQIPKGMYIALFPVDTSPDRGAMERGEALSARSQAIPAGEASKVMSQPTTQPAIRWGRSMMACAIIALAGTAVTGVAFVTNRPGITEKPMIYVQMDATDANLAGEASQARDTLLIALARFGTLTVARSGYAADAAQPGRGYELHLKYYAGGDERNLWWQVAATGGDNVLRSGVETVDATGRSQASIYDQLTGQLAVRIASSRGVINMQEVQVARDDGLGNTCILRAEHALESGSTDSLAKVRRCLERSLAYAPGNADTNAILSRVMLAGKNAAKDPAIRAKAMELARSAVVANPLSDRSQIAMMAAQFANGSVDAALQAGNRAVELNPYNVDATAKLAFLLYLCGYRDAAVAMARSVDRVSDMVRPADALLVLALDAYKTGDYSDASLLSEQINGADSLVEMIRTASLGQLNSPNSRERLANVTNKSSNFNDGFRNGMSWWRLQETINAEFESGLLKAGVKVNDNVITGALTR